MVRNEKGAHLWASLTLFILSSLAPSQISRAQSSPPNNQVKWQSVEGRDHFETALAQTWTLPQGSRTERFQFSAIRFHLGYFQLKLIGVSDFVKRNPKQIANSQNANSNLSSLFELGLKAIYDAKPFDDIIALAPGGFPASERKPINLGFLKTDGVTLSQVLNDGPSAILCLDSPKYMNKGYQFQLPVFYRPDEGSQQELLSKCRDAVQVGLRILEDPNSRAKENSTLLTYKRSKKNGDLDPQQVYLGIPAKFASRSTPYFRTVFALDEPGRDDPDEKSREVARNAYIIVTETPVTLWEVQNLLTSPAFYANDQYAPYWAVNLVGGDYAGLVLKPAGSDAKPIGIGNTVITQASILAVVPRN